MKKFNDLYKKEGEPFISTWFYDRIAYVIVSLIYKLPVTPNQITVLSFIMATVSIYYFYVNSYVLASLFMTIFFILDCTDGILARNNNLTSNFGDFLDHTFGTIFIYLIYFAIAWNLESKTLAFLLLLSIVLYNYGVGITPKNIGIISTQQKISKGLIKPSYIGFGFDIQSFIILISCLTGSLIYGLYIITLTCFVFSFVRLIIVTKGAKND